MENLERILSDHPFFEGMTEEQLRVLSGCTSNVRIPAGAFVFREGEAADSFYCIRVGQVALEIYSPEKGPVPIDNRGAGEVLGWSWIITPFTWYCDARAVEDVRALALDGRCLRGKCEKDRILGYELYTRFVPLMHRSLEATRLQLMDLYGS